MMRNGSSRVEGATGHRASGSLEWTAALAGRTRTLAGMLGLCWLAALQTAGCASQPPVAEAAPRPAHVIREVRTVETAEAVAVIVKSDQPLIYAATRREDPPGVYFQFPGTGLEGPDAAYFPPLNPVIRSIRSAAAEHEARVLVELTQDASYEARPDPEGLKIVFRKPSAGAAFGRMPGVPGIDEPALKTPPGTSKTEPGTPSMAAAAPARVASVLREVRTEARVDAVLIRLKADGPVKTANVFTLDHPARIVFDFMGLHSAFKGEQRIPVRSEWVSQVRHLAYPDKVRLVADTEVRHLKSYSMEPTAYGLVITVGARRQ